MDPGIIWLSKFRPVVSCLVQRHILDHPVAYVETIPLPWNDASAPSHAGYIEACDRNRDKSGSNAQEGLSLQRTCARSLDLPYFFSE